MRRALFWTAAVLAIGALVCGGAYAYVGYRATSGPDGTVQGYFAALARSDAPAALAFGDVPAGPHGLLTSAVLAQQQKLAPLHDLRILDSSESGGTASVRYSYQLGFARGNQEFTGTLALRHSSSGWRLTRTAVATTLRLDQADDRISLAGTSVPQGATLLFPGALPLRFDTPYLQLDQQTSAVQFGGGTTIDLGVEPTAAAQASVTAGLTRLVTACVSGTGTATALASCPLPDSRVVPGSLRGRITGSVAARLTYRVASDASGVISLSGSLPFTGTYRRLAFDNVAETRTGSLALRVDAAAFAVAPLTVRFVAAP